MKGKNFLDHFEERLGAALFVAVFAILVAQIVSRQIFDSPLIWSEELAKLLFVYVGMLGVSIGVKGDQHVMIDFFYEKLSPRVRKFVFTGIQLLILISIIALIVLGYKLFMRKIRFELIALKISAGWMYAALPSIGTLMLLRYFQTGYRHYKSGKLIFSPKEVVAEKIQVQADTEEVEV